MTQGNSAIDTERYRLRRFVEQLIQLDEVEVHEEPVPLVNLSPIIEAATKAVLFKEAGPERAEIVAKTAGSRRRLAAAFGTTEDRLYDAYYRRVAEPQPVVEIPSNDAPVHAIVVTGRDVDLTRLPFHPQHAYDGSCYISAAMDFTVDPTSGRRNVGCRRLSLRNRYECGTNITAPSDLKRIYHACVARGEKLPVTFTVGAHPLDFVAATMRQGDDELALIAQMRGEPTAIVKSLTNDILVPADAEMVLEGYLDERGYVEPEGPYGEYMGYYGAIHMDPVFHCTAIAMRRDVLHLSLLHGSADVLDQTDSANISALRTEAEALRILKASGRDPVAAQLCMRSGGANNLRVALRQRTPGEARQAIATLFGALRPVKHIFVFDDDIDIRDEGQVAWALGTRFQADQDLLVLARHARHDDGPLARRAAHRRQGRVRLHQATGPRRRHSADPRRREGLRRPGAVPVGRGGARRRADVLRRYRRGDRQRRRARGCRRARPAARGRPPRARPRRPLLAGGVASGCHRHRRRALPRPQ